MLGRLLFTLGVMCLLSSCRSDIDNLDLPKVQDEKRIVFESESDFMNTYKAISSYDKKGLKDWSCSKKINSLLGELEKNNLEEVCLPQALQSILNKNAEFQIKDSVIRYDNNNFYLIATDNTKLKSPVVVGNVKSNILGNSKLARGYFEIGVDEIDASNQHEFRWEPNKYLFKYVHELRTYYLAFANSTEYRLSLIVKLEYKGKKWNVAGESRKLSLDLTTSVALIPSVINETKYNRLSDVVVAGNNEINLASYTFLGSPIRQWNVLISGYVAQEIYGYPGTGWIDYR